MSSSDWEEVKRLAADFQRAQLSSTVQRYVTESENELMLKVFQHVLQPFLNGLTRP